MTLISWILRKFDRFVQRYPKLEELALGIMGLMPTIVKSLMHGILHGKTNEPLQFTPQEPSDLTPRAARIYAKLEKAIEERKG